MDAHFPEKNGPKEWLLQGGVQLGTCIYIRSTYYPGYYVGVSPKKCLQQPTPHFLSSASVIPFLSIILLFLLQAVPLPVAL